ncbi:MAG: TerB family tellurite resistance protein [Alphaproteobacteria bacterium]|nr:TerB family tellurite resistance protein [Alphaproteobacteria bacterium]
MFARLKRLVTEPSSASGSERQHSFEERQLAAAALMVEAAKLDDDFDVDERARIETLLKDQFSLTAAEAGELLSAAEQASDDSVEWQGFTRKIKDGFAPEERIQLIEMLWEVAYADGVLHDYEASLIRRITGLLYVSDRDSGEARKRVRTRLGLVV